MNTFTRISNTAARGSVLVLEFVLVACLLAILVMVFGNVMLRYGFDRGIVLSEELSRFAFVWMTFLGAVIAAREGLHLGVDSLTSRLPEGGRRACALLTELLIIGCCAILFWGTWRQHDVNASSFAPASGMPLIWVFGVGYFCSVGIALISLLRVVSLLRGGSPDLKPLQGNGA